MTGYWIICKLKPMRRRTVRVKMQYQRYKARSGETKYRPVPNTGQERFTQQVIIENAGLQCWIPARYVYRHANRYSVTKREKKQVIKSTLGSWAFVFISAPVDLYTLQRTDCVAYIGRKASPSGDGAFAFSDEDMQKHVFSNPEMQDCAASKQEKYMRTNLEYEIGDTVKVVEGPLADQVFEVRDIDNDKAIILVDMLGKAQEIEVDAFSLAKCS